LGTELETISNEMDGEILAVMLRVNNNLPNIEENIRSQEKKIHQLIFETHRDKKKIAWGASGNGVVILNRLGIKTEVIEYVIDSDLNKQGKYIPGTQQLIVSPSAIACIKPDVIFIFSQLHKTEIQNQLKEIYKKPIVIETI